MSREVPSLFDVSELTRAEIHEGVTTDKWVTSRIIYGRDLQQGEAMWVKKVPKSRMHDRKEAYILCNCPLNDGIELYDLVRPRGDGHEKGYDVVARVYANILGFSYEYSEVDVIRKRKIKDVVRSKFKDPLTRVIFHARGYGSVYFPDNSLNSADLSQALDALEFETLAWAQKT